MALDLQDLIKKLGYHFEKASLLEQALSHRSSGAIHNERLEFLGDAILSCIIADELFHRYPDMREGDLSRLRSSLVNGETLANIAKTLGLGPYLQLGAGEIKTGGRDRASILADAFEAIVGAVYLDAGLDAVRKCVLRWYGNTFDGISKLAPQKDPKSCLQEWLQANKYPLPVYDVCTMGKAHAQTFYVTCKVEGLSFVTQGQSNSRRKAEQQAAQRFLDLLNEH